MASERSYPPFPVRELVCDQDDKAVHTSDDHMNGSTLTTYDRIPKENCMKLRNPKHHERDPEYDAARIKQKRKGRRRKNDSILDSLYQFIASHQIGLAANLLALLMMTHACFPRARSHTRKFWQMSYYNPTSKKYALGWDDSFLVVFWLVLFTGLRAVVMDSVLTPLAHMLGLNDKKEKTRFAEQAWVLIYDTTFWSLGMVCAHQCAR
ncbi:MAG: hypothetical protein Q9200_000594 [Gallowayella weberi]